jgi:hypothetical protein
MYCTDKMEAVCSSETRELLAKHTLIANHLNRFSTDEGLYSGVICFETRLKYTSYCDGGICGFP